MCSIQSSDDPSIQSSDIKHWMSVLNVILNKDAHSHEYRFVLGHTMAEALINNLEALDAAIKYVKAGFCPFLECFDSRGIKGVAGTYLWLTPVPLVTNHTLVCRDPGLESVWLSKDLQVVLPCRKMPVDQHN
jgi:hypothetical protein